LHSPRRHPLRCLNRDSHSKTKDKKKQHGFKGKAFHGESPLIFCLYLIINYSLICFLSLFVFFVCLYAQFLRVQRKRTSSVLYGERKGSRSLGPSKRDFPALLEYTGSL
jgi:hypothetical protein